MKIGLFGGTFNPIHFGHLRSALEVQAGFGLDQVIFIPAAVPPHKNPGAVAAAADRLKMIELAVAGSPGFTISDVEIRREGPSFTIDTARHFRQAHAPETRIHLIVGLDAFLEIDSWRSFRELLALVPVIVITRPGPAGGEPEQERAALEGYIRSTLAPGCVTDGDPGVFQAPGIEPITLFPVTALDISSTRLRRLAGDGGSLQYLVPEEVRRYIQIKGLYL
jgi:nicotinate-nucleotide adenylyltransferase